MELAVIGINFRTAPLGVRERVSYTAGAARSVLERLREDLPGREYVLLSTCNRTELYVAAPRSRMQLEDVIRGFLAGGGELPQDLADNLYVKEDLAAVSHAMTVATSMDSLVVGETEILGQVKQAYALAVEAGTAGKTLNTLMQQVFRVAKRVRTETDLSEGRVSIASIAVDLTDRIFDDLATKTVLIIGAGKMAEQTIRSLLSKGVRECYVVNRSLERGRQLADQYGSIAIPYEKLDEMLPRADIVISSTSAPHCIVRTEAVRAAMARRQNRPAFLVDLAVPRDIEEGVGALDNVYLYNLDDLEQTAKLNLAKRHGAIGAAQAIIREEAEEVAAGFQAERSGIGDAMKMLDRTIADIEETELTRGFAKKKVAPLEGVCDECRDEICAMLHRALSRMAAGQRKAMHRAAREGRWEEFAGYLEEMAGSDEPTKEDRREGDT